MDWIPGPLPSGEGGGECHRLSGEDGDARLLRLMRLAVEELAIEERELQTRSASSSVRTGLAYPLYETTLAYLIWKSWQPFEEVVWDAVPRSAANLKTKIDLVVFDKKSATRSVEHARFVLELKWANNRRGEIGAKKDVEKLRKVEGDSRRFLLLAWWEYADIWDGAGGDTNRTRAGVDEWFGELGADVQRCYLAWFPSLVATADRRPTVFVVALAELKS